MKRKLAVQLYSLRNEAEKQGIANVLKTVAQIGFKGVECCGFHELKTAAEFKKVCSDLGLELASSHRPWCNIDNIDESIDIAGDMGLKRIVCGYGPDDFKDLDTIKATAEKTNIMVERTAAAGFELFQHNHYWEFDKIDGRLKYEIYAELCPKVKFQLDAFWSANFGLNDAAEMMKKFYDRVVLIHMKDGILVDPQSALKIVNGTYEKKLELRPLGEGDLNIPEILDAAPTNIDNVIIELDNSPYDMTYSLRRSYEYLMMIGQGLGNKEVTAL